MARPDTKPSYAALALTALRRTNPKAWQKKLRDAFANGQTVSEAAEEMGVSRLTLQRHAKALEHETGKLLPRPRSGRKDGS